MLPRENGKNNAIRAGADRAAEVEGEDPRARVAPELERHQGEEHALAGTGRAGHEGVADVPNMERKTGRRGRRNADDVRCGAIAANTSARPTAWLRTQS